MTTLAEYNARALEARIAAANYPAKLLETAAQIDVACASIGDHVRWSLDPEESEADHRYWANAMIERAHELLDLAHDFKQAVKR